MAEEELYNLGRESQNGHEDSPNLEESIVKVSGMYNNWFLDYASYVILERAVPSIHDGLKPVQRRILHSLRELHDGRFHKVANLVGNTMKYHPHGDTSINDALVQLGQKELLIETQGNWGNIHTGDSAAAARYIEARLSRLALKIGFNPKITNWQPSYDGRNKEPVYLPMKFPLLLAQGVEGIAVGLSTKILPHNFNEIIDACIKHLRGKKTFIFPDFISAGIADCSQYNDGARGGKIRVRAKIEKRNNTTLLISEIPYNTTTSSIIDSILKANDKGKIKIKKIDDNTASEIEILIHLDKGVSPDKTIDALFAFTNCEINISPITCVIENEKPIFCTVSHILHKSTEDTKEIFRKELEIKLDELLSQLHFSTLERIFIENKIYRDIEKQETWQDVLDVIDKGVRPFVKDLVREVLQEDIIRLTEIKIIRISKFDLDKAIKKIERLKFEIQEIKNHLNSLVKYTIDYYKELKKQFGKNKKRRTLLQVFDEIEKQKVAIANVKMHANLKEGFIGTGLKKDEFIFDCSDIDDIIIFKRNATMLVTKVSQKTFVGKDIIHLSVFKKGDNRRVFNIIYKDGASKYSYMKRFSVTSVTRDKEYNLSKTKNSKILYFSDNRNGEAEKVWVHLRSSKKLRKLKFEIDFSSLTIKGRQIRGNLVSKHTIKRIELKEEGISTLPPRKIWFDSAVKKINTDQRGELLGSFAGGEKLIVIYQTGFVEIIDPDVSRRFADDLLLIEKWNPKIPLSCIYFNSSKKTYYVKRFNVDNISTPQVFLPNERGNKLELICTQKHPLVQLKFKVVDPKKKQNQIIDLGSFIDVKGISAKGNQLTKYAVEEFIIIKEELIDNDVDKTINSKPDNKNQLKLKLDE